MAEAGPSTSTANEEPTQTVTTTEECQEEGPPTLHLRLRPPKSEHKVKWSTDTVDNEFMGKKKSKCCCIYEKPKVFGESDTSSSDEDGDGCTPHCRGHKKKCYRHHKDGQVDDMGHCEHQDPGGRQGGGGV